MNEPNYKDILNDLQLAVVGDITTLDVDRERLARDTSLFYVKPEIIVYPKTRDHISNLLAYATEARKHNINISVTFRSAGTCMTGGSLTQSILVDTTKYLTHVYDVTEFSASAEPGCIIVILKKRHLHMAG